MEIPGKYNKISCWGDSKKDSSGGLKKFVLGSYLALIWGLHPMSLQTDPQGLAPHPQPHTP